MIRLPKRRKGEDAVALLADRRRHLQRCTRILGSALALTHLPVAVGVELLVGVSGAWHRRAYQGVHLDRSSILEDALTLTHLLTHEHNPYVPPQIVSMVSAFSS